jgi:hypothetical protein
MTLTNEQLTDALDALSEHLSETALTIKEIHLRLSQLRDLATPDQEQPETTCLPNLTRSILGKPFYRTEDFEF